MSTRPAKLVIRGSNVKFLRVFGLLLILGNLAAVAGFSQVGFVDATVNTSQNLLFRAVTEAPRFSSYATGFLSNLSNRSHTQLSFFPEEASLIAGGKALQIQNRFGVFRSNDSFTAFEPVAQYPAFVNGAEIASGKINTLVTSPDGKWLSYLKRTSPAFGDLVLVNLETQTETVVSNNVELDLSRRQISWSPNSDFFMYQKNNRVYYFSIDQFVSGRLLSEDFRSMGAGQISSVTWGINNELYFVSGSLVYQVLGVEFFTRSLYQEFLKTGKIVGTLPYSFDPNFDRFWISPDGSQILIDKNGRSVYLYFLQSNDFTGEGTTIQLPYLYLPRNTQVTKVLWSTDGVITILTTSLDGGSITSRIYRLDANARQETYTYTILGEDGVSDLVLSPQGTYTALLRADRVEIRNYKDWALVTTFQLAGPIKALFLSDNQVILAGTEETQLADISAKSARFLFFSQLAKLGYSKSSGAILGIQGSRVLEYNPQNGAWQTPADAADTAAAAGAGSAGSAGAAGNAAAAIATALFAEPNTATSDYRVYMENLTSGAYRNMIMVRKIRDIGTVSLFDPPVTRYEPFPTRDDVVDPAIFHHGSRIRAREVSLVFNGIDSVEGLTTILRTLSEYRIRATFFLNGDFIRRHPGAVREIADSGHEVGSLFTVYFNMADSRYQITNQFVRQGLASNEDEYFETTGRELSLLWHAPYYFTNPTIIAAGQAMNYQYVGRDVDSLDWVPKRDDTGISRLYYPSAELIESVLERKKPGSIISLTIGRPGDDRADGGRDDYLFNKLNLLLNNLIERGYSVVPVSTLIDRAK